MSHPTQIGDYRIERQLGAGAMGCVYLAVETGMFDRRVALKILSETLSASEQARLRFQQEVKTAARLAHPNIITIHRHGEHEGRPYFVMEYVEGEDLSPYIADPGRRPLAWKLDVGHQICQALACAHARGLIHRDVKPPNIMVTSQGTVKLLDFGIVHVAQSGMTTEHTQPGTFAYMSPEQLRGQKLDARSDLFSFGLVLHGLISGFHPFQAANDLLVSNRILSEDPDPLVVPSGEITPSMQALAASLIRKNRDERPDSAKEVAEALMRLRMEIGVEEGDAEVDPGIEHGLRASRQALMRGDTDESRKHLVEILRTDPGHEAARVALNELVEIASGARPMPQPPPPVVEVVAPPEPPPPPPEPPPLPEPEPEPEPEPAKTVSVEPPAPNRRTPRERTIRDTRAALRKARMGLESGQVEEARRIFRNLSRRSQDNAELDDAIGDEIEDLGRRLARKRRSWIFAAAVTLVGIGLGAAYLLLDRERPSPPQQARSTARPDPVPPTPPPSEEALREEVVSEATVEPEGTVESPSVREDTVSMPERGDIALTKTAPPPRRPPPPEPVSEARPEVKRAAEPEVPAPSAPVPSEPYREPAPPPIVPEVGPPPAEVLPEAGTIEPEVKTPTRPSEETQAIEEIQMLLNTVEDAIKRRDTKRLGELFDGKWREKKDLLARLKQSKGESFLYGHSCFIALNGLDRATASCRSEMTFETAIMPLSTEELEREFYLEHIDDVWVIRGSN